MNGFAKSFQGQMSESFLTAGVLSLAGGLQDAYTYISRGGVFANAQTGNIVLLSQCVGKQDWAAAARYLIPVLSFALGVAIAEEIHQFCRSARRLHWRQVVLMVEIVLLLIVGFLPNTRNLLANAVVSFSCAMQVQAFRKVNGYAFASTMCIGNIRSGMEALCAYQRTRNPQILHKAGAYFGIIFLFALGAGLGGCLLPIFGQGTIWCACLLLFVGFLLMFIPEEENQHHE